MNTRRTRHKFHTDPISCDVPAQAAVSQRETEFEKQRGISGVDIRTGFAQVQVSDLEGDVSQERLHVLAILRDAGISLDFLKFTPTGLSFLISETEAPKVTAALTSAKGTHQIDRGRSVVLVHAVNMRDEEGLLAEVVSAAISSGAAIDHLGDMHDRLLIVTSAEGANLIKKTVIGQFLGGQA